MGIIFRAKGLVKNYYPVGNEEENKAVHVLQGVDFQIEENAYVAFMGKSGCGKTTLLKILGLIEKHTKGELYYKGKRAASMAENEKAMIRRQQLGFVFQDYYLMESLSVEENIVLPMLIDRARATDSIKRARKFERILGISALAKKKPYELSGGEKQRAAVCRALINDPEVILADEPTGNLDSKASEVLISFFENIHEKMNKSIIMVTHDPQVASHCRRVIFLKDGMILEDLKRMGTTEEFYEQILKHMSKL